MLCSSNWITSSFFSTAKATCGCQGYRRVSSTTCLAWRLHTEFCCFTSHRTNSGPGLASVWCSELGESWLIVLSPSLNFSLTSNQCQLDTSLCVWRAISMYFRWRPVEMFDIWGQFQTFISCFTSSNCHLWSSYFHVCQIENNDRWC